MEMTGLGLGAVPSIGGHVFKLRRYLRGHYLECVLAPTFKGLEAILQLIAPLVMAQIIDFGTANRDAGFVECGGVDEAMRRTFEIANRIEGRE